MTPYSVNIMFYIIFEVPDWQVELKARNEILIQMIRIAKIKESKLLCYLKLCIWKTSPAKNYYPLKT